MELLTVREVAEILRVPEARAYALLRTGRLPGLVQIGRQRRVRADVLRQFIETGGKPLPGGWKNEPAGSDR